MEGIGRFLKLKEHLYVISDTHFGHKNIIRMCRQEFIPMAEGREAQLEFMHASMIKEGNEVIKDGDKVIHLGDVALDMGREKLKAIMDQLNGTKMLIPGNHDRAKLEKNRHYFNNVGFKNVEVDVKQIEIQYRQDEPHLFDYGKDVGYGNVILSHEPIEHVPEGFINIHGHVHNGIAEELYGMDKRRINVCGDATKREI